MFDKLKRIFYTKEDGRDGFTKWSNGLKIISDFISDNKRLPNASSDNKSENNLYQSYSATKRKFNSKKLSDKQLEFLKQHNIVFDNIKSVSDKWKIKVLEISDFITKNEHYPKANRKDDNEEKLYHALARIRRAKEKDKLSVEQSDFLDQNNIILEKKNKYDISENYQSDLIEQNDMLAKNDLKIKFKKDVVDLFDVYDSTINPFKVSLKSDKSKFNVFLKNISPAYFDNKDISRIQIAKTMHFELIRKQNKICIPVGYDLANNIYVVWNPYIFLERINEKMNISIYSRVSEQKKAIKRDCLDFKLSNQELVFAVNPKFIGIFLSNFNEYFKTKNYIKQGVSGPKDLVKKEQIINLYNLNTQLYSEILKFLINRKKMVAVKIVLDYKFENSENSSFKEALLIIDEISKAEGIDTSRA